MTTIYRDNDADLNALSGKTVAVVGYGNQGRSQALNLRDSGVSVVVGGLRDSSLSKAEADGFETLPVEEAAMKCQVLMLLVPDEVQREVYEQKIAPHLQEGDALVFAHGYNIRYGLITPAEGVDVVMVAPRMVGPKVRERFEAGSGSPAYVAGEQDASGSAWETTLALAKGIGATRAGAVRLTFAEETELDLFMEQGTWAAIFRVLSQSFEFLTEKGFDPTVVALELYGSGEGSEVMNLMRDVGFFKQLNLHSKTSQYGSLSRADRMIPAGFDEAMSQSLDEIRNGEFAKEWAKEQSSDYPNYKRLVELSAQHPINQADESLAALLGRE